VSAVAKRANDLFGGGACAHALILNPSCDLQAPTFDVLSVTIEAVTPLPYILAIESSCDETAAAIVEGGERLVSSVVASQIATHQPFGGVVPELASREHLRNIVPVVHGALREANMSLDQLDAIAVTKGPGLAGALLVGVSYAKALAFGADKPLIAVNHLEGHIHAVLLEQRQAGNRDLKFPVLALVVSGGHTHLYLTEQVGHAWKYRNIGHTRDDAAGEAFDKVAKLLGLGYPGGPIIDRLSKFGDPKAVRFTLSQLKRADRNAQGPRKQAFASTDQRFDFSYSGIKTAVLRHVETHNMQAAIEERRAALLAIKSPTIDDYKRVCDQETLDLVASFQRAMVDDLVAKTLEAAMETASATLLVTGGVAANSELRQTFEQRGAREGFPVYFPSRPLSTDNAAMIAAAAYSKWLTKEFSTMDVSGEAHLPLR
jgi:N6-L-threonylcarbamoyladenine synthase